MPSGNRIRSNSEFGTITDNPLTAGGTTFSSARLALFPVVSSAHAVVTLDPRALNGEPEIVIVTAHTAAAITATISRGAYGTVARSHPSGTEWIHAPVNEDFVEILTAATRPSDPFRGQQIFQTDTNSYFARTTADTWANVNMLADPPAYRGYWNISVSINSAGTWQTLGMNTERYDNDNMHDNAVNNTRVVANTPGLYLFTFHIDFAFNATGSRGLAILFNGATHIAGHTEPAPAATIGTTLSLATVYRMAAGQYVEPQVFQNSGSTITLNRIDGNSPEFSATWIGR